MGVEITGLDELIASFEESNHEIQPIMKKAVRAGARVIRKAIAERAPVRAEGPSGDALPPGAIKSDIVIRKIKDAVADTAVSVGPAHRTAFVVRWLEFGHNLVKGGRGKSGHKIGFVPARPLIRPAFEESQQAASQAIEASIMRQIKKILGGK